MKITKVFFRLKKGLKSHLSVYYLYIFMKNIRWDFFFSYPLLCFSRFFSWLKTQTKIGICSSWTLWSTVEIWAWHPPLPHTIFLSLEFRVGDTCSTKRKSRHQEEEDQRAHTKRRYCVLCYAPQLEERRRRSLAAAAKRERFSTPWLYERSMQVKGSRTQQRTRWVSLLWWFEPTKIFNIFWITKNSENIKKKIGKYF